MIFTALARISTVLLACLMLHSCQNCVTGEGKVVQESQAVDSFAVVALNCAADVFISQNRMPRTVTVKAQENILELIEIKLNRGELVIDSKQCFSSDEAIEVYVNSNVVEGLEINGSGDIHTLTNLRGQKLEIKIDGSGDLTAEVDYRLLTAGIQGSGDIHLAGKADRMEVSINGSGDVKGPNMTCESTSVSINGSGDAFVNSEKYLECHINGSGDIRYTGFPTDTIFSVHGSGMIRSAY